MRPLAFLLVLFAAPAAASSVADGNEALGGILGEARAIGSTPSPRPAAPPAARSVDLRAQTGWPSGAPDQGEIGDCHVFAATALLNAAYHRQYRRTKRFSPADLFIQSVLLSGSHGNFVSAIGERTAPQEGFTFQADVEQALAAGVAEDSTLPHAVFERAYLRRILPESNRAMLRADASGALTRMANHLSAASLSEGPDAPAYRAAVREMEAQMSADAGRNRRLVEQLFRRRWPELVRERSLSRDEFAAAGFRLERKEFAHSGDTPKQRFIRSNACAEAKTYLMRQLDAGRPVGVSYDLGGAGARAWGVEGLAPPAAGSSFHAFVIVGHEPAKAGVRFLTLNSWGPQGNVPLPETALCHLVEAATVLASVDGAP